MRRGTQYAIGLQPAFGLLERHDVILRPQARFAHRGDGHAATHHVALFADIAPLEHTYRTAAVHRLSGKPQVSCKLVPKRPCQELFARVAEDLAQASVYN